MGTLVLAAAGIDDHVNAVVAGVAIGSVYGLIAIGYTIVFRATRIFNFAQGDLVMVGVMLSYYFLTVHHLPQPVAFVLVVAAVCAISLVEERVAVRRLLDSPDSIAWFITTLGFSVVLEGVVLVLYGTKPAAAVPSFLGSTPLRVGSVTLSRQLALAIVTLAVVMAAVLVFYRATWWGQAMRAASEDRAAASLRGIDPARVSRLAFALGGVVSGITGFVLAPIVFSDPSVGLAYSLKGFLAIAIGGFGSLPGAAVGGWIIGIAEQVTDVHVSAAYETTVGLVLLLVVLAVRPLGLFRRKGERLV